MDSTRKWLNLCNCLVLYNETSKNKPQKTELDAKCIKDVSLEFSERAQCESVLSASALWTFWTRSFFIGDGGCSEHCRFSSSAPTH